jgi:hypothetical protein
VISPGRTEERFLEIGNLHISELDAEGRTVLQFDTKTLNSVKPAYGMLIFVTEPLLRCSCSWNPSSFIAYKLFPSFLIDNSKRPMVLLSFRTVVNGVMKSSSYTYYVETVSVHNELLQILTPLVKEHKVLAVSYPFCACILTQLTLETRQVRNLFFCILLFWSWNGNAGLCILRRDFSCWIFSSNSTGTSNSREVCIKCFVC